MIHDLFIVGDIRTIQISTPKDPKKGESALMLIQWGPQRDRGESNTNFINAGYVRIPNYRFPKIKDKLRVGQQVKINGHVQGIVKTVDGEQFMSNELVADRVFVLKEPVDPEAVAAAPAPAQVAE